MPMPAPGGLSPASSDLGLGSMLSDQVAGETEEQRKKRLQQLQQQRFMSPAASSLLGGDGLSGLGAGGSLGGGGFGRY
jgi:hypothetical protein